MIVLGFSGKAGAGKDSAANALMEQMRADGLRVQRLSFAGKLKDGCAVMFGWDRDRLNDDAFYKEGGLGGWVPKSNPGAKPMTADEIDDRIADPCKYGLGEYAYPKERSWLLDDFVELDTDPVCVALGMTRRTIMQRFGTECMRDGLDQNVWIKLVEIAMQKGEYDDVDIGIISDARFLNELEFIHYSGGLNILILRIDPDATLTQHTDHSSEQEWQAWTNWDVVVQNNPQLGLDLLKQGVVQLVYTKLVQRGIGRFPAATHRALIGGSLYGTISIPTNWADPRLTAAAPTGPNGEIIELNSNVWFAPAGLNKGIVGDQDGPLGQAFTRVKDTV